MTSLSYWKTEWLEFNFSKSQIITFGREYIQSKCLISNVCILPANFLSYLRVILQPFFSGGFTRKLCYLKVDISLLIFHYWYLFLGPRRLAKSILKMFSDTRCIQIQGYTRCSIHACSVNSGWMKEWGN